MWSETNQQLTQLAADLLGPEALTARHRAGATSCCARAATRSRAAPPRSSRTSSPSACSACPRTALGGDADGLRLHRRPARDQAHRARPARRPRSACERVREARRGRPLRRRRCGSELCELGWPGHRRSPRSTAARASAPVELAILLEELGLRVAPRRRSCRRALAAAADRARRLATSSSARWLPGLASGELTGARRHAPRRRRRARADGAEARRGRARRGRRHARCVARAEAEVEPRRRDRPDPLGRAASRAARGRRGRSPATPTRALDRALVAVSRRARRRLRSARWR